MTGSCDLTQLAPKQWRNANKFRNVTWFCVTRKAKTASRARKYRVVTGSYSEKNCTQLIRQYYSPFVTLTIHINYHCSISQSNCPQVNKSNVRTVTVHHNSSSFIAHRFAVFHMEVLKQFHCFLRLWLSWLKKKYWTLTSAIRLPASYQKNNDLPFREYRFPKIIAILLDNIKRQMC